MCSEHLSERGGRGGEEGAGRSRKRLGIFWNNNPQLRKLGRNPARPNTGLLVSLVFSNQTGATPGPMAPGIGQGMAAWLSAIFIAGSNIHTYKARTHAATQIFLRLCETNTRVLALTAHASLQSCEARAKQVEIHGRRSSSLTWRQGSGTPQAQKFGMPLLSRTTHFFHTLEKPLGLSVVPALDLAVAVAVVVLQSTHWISSPANRLRYS